MDHTGGYYMAIAILLALVHRKRTGEGQWVDLACTEAALSLTGPALLDWTVNGRPARRAGQPDSNRSDSPPMAPHGVYRCRGDDEWIAIACRSDADWARLAAVIGEPWSGDSGYATLAGRLADEDGLDSRLNAWTSQWDKFDLAQRIRTAQVPASAVAKPEERIDHDPDTAWLWPTVSHREMGEVRVDGLPVRMSLTPWRMERGAPCLGQHNDDVLGRLAGLSADEVAQLKAEGVL
jgi:crotonobetainyl-CoA:carnitine CoA-transferase CaiB-like acyl-CoA transferase